MRRILMVSAALLALVGGACADGGGGSGASGDGEVRTVLIDYRHDQFASAFLRYYPADVVVHQGDTVRFKQSWSGEAHSVTMGSLVDDLFKYQDIFLKYDSVDAALADGVPQATIDDVLATVSRVPPMVGDGQKLYQPGAQPCYVVDRDDVPEFQDPETEKVDESATCPTKGDDQPDFDGRHALYNSGFIPFDGDRANTFEVPIADDAEPGTYRYFCNLHWTNMGGTIEVVAPGAPIATQAEVNRKAREEIEADAKVAVDRVAEVRKGRFGTGDDTLTPPLAGLEADEEFAVIINEFLPDKVTSKVGQKVTWTFDGISHTVSFNVPKYFPVFTVGKGGEVEWNPKSYEPVGFDVPAQVDDDGGGPPGEGPPPKPVEIDAGKWDGKGGFHSSGAIDPPDRFSVTFTRAGTYPYACVLHPQMVGTLVVKA